jgi:hypothetical protein
MNTAKRYFLIILCFTVGLTTFSVFTPRVAHAIATALVTVMNTASNPIPTQPVHARQAVYLACQTTLASGDMGSDADVCSLFDSSLHSTTRGIAYVVPSGKRLVVDFVTAQAVLPSGETVNSSLTTNGTVNNIYLTLRLSTTLAGGTANAIDVLNSTLSTVAYSDPGSHLTFACNRNSGQGTANCTVEAFAHLEDIQ